MQWLGWSTDGRRLAWRQGGAKDPQRPGRPLEIARVDKRGAIVDRLHVATDVRAALHARHIFVRHVAELQRVAPADVLVRAAAGQVFAVVVRGNPAQAAVLAKRGGAYEPVARWAVRSPATQVEAAGFADDDGRLLALVVHTGAGRSRQASLIVVPLQADAGPQPAPTEVTATTR